MEKRQIRLRDYFREAMFWEPGARALAGIGAALTAAFLLVSMRGLSELGGGGWIAAAGALCFALLLAGCWRTAKGSPLVLLLFAALLLMLGIGANLSLFWIVPGRMKNVLQPMLDGMWNYELRTAMAWEPGAWSGGYLVFMALLSRLESFSPLYAVKLLDLFSLTMAALAVLSLAERRGASRCVRLLAPACALLLPTALLNAGFWAQCDAVFAALALWGLAFLLRDRPLAGCLLFGAALAFKLQSAFLFPLLPVLFMTRRVRVRHLLALALAFLVFHLPMLLEGQGLPSVLGRYEAQIRLTAYGEETEEEEESGEEEEAGWEEDAPEEEAEAEEPEAAPTHEGLASHAASVYSLMTVASVREFSGMGRCLGIACALLVVFALLKSRRPLTPDVLMTAALLLAAGLPLILPQTNARMLYLAGLLSLPRADSRLRLAEAVLLETVSLCCYVEAIFSTEAAAAAIFPASVLSLAAIAAACMIAWELLCALTGRAPGGERDA